MANHLIIGLGGTGGSVLREFRKRVFQEFRSEELIMAYTSNICMWIPVTTTSTRVRDGI